ncbi:vascular cell adhesion protein 1-like [Rhinoderma darwinii]|uniref:vascular cell adhesion protein 1-like n=1 Tax=Rhinoderma darwinii TaxID=43563 RepID=UPI003F678F3E
MQGFYLILLPILVAFISIGKAEEPCELRSQSSEVFVPLGEWISLECSFNCPSPVIWKTRLRKKIPQFDSNRSTVEVLVDDWEKSDLYCIQTLNDGRSIESKSVVRAYALYSNVTIDLDQELEEGKVHQVTCTVYDVAPVENLQIMLVRANTVIHKSTFKEDGRKGKQMVKAKYEVLASRMDNLQNFSCLTTLESATGVLLTVNSSSVTVRTYGQPDVPSVTISPESNIQEGDAFKITCQSDGSPRPEYHWIVPTGADVIYTQNNSILLVTTAGPSHNGIYTCEATNKYGRVSSFQNIQVTPLTKGLPRSHIGDIISSVLVFIIITPVILWKTIICSSEPRDSV